MNLIEKAMLTTTLLLTATVAHAVHCTINTTPLNFGLYDVFSAMPVDSTGSISVSCSNPEKKQQQVTITVSSGSSGSFNQRQMTNAVTGSGVLYYNLYGDPARSQIVGDGSGGTLTFVESINRTFPWNIILYGRIPARQNVTPGVYRDTLTATVIW